MKIEYENVMDYLYFLTNKYGPYHYESLCTICNYEQSVQGSSIKRLLTFVLAYFENNIALDSPIVIATNELLMNCYEQDMEETGAQKYICC